VANFHCDRPRQFGDFALKKDDDDDDETSTNYNVTNALAA